MRCHTYFEVWALEVITSGRLLISYHLIPVQWLFKEQVTIRNFKTYNFEL